MKELARGLCPPLFWRWASRIRTRLVAKPRKMFSGVYQAFENVRDEYPWNSNAYHETCRYQLHECQSNFIHPSAVTTHALLAFIVNSLPKDRTPRILDWAGGTGLRYWTTRPALNRAVQWHVVDNPKLALVSHEIMGRSEELCFTEKLPEPSSSSFDIVLVYSSLQYVESQSKFLATLADYHPRYIVLPRLMAHPENSYVTCQNVQGYLTPSKVSSLKEISATFKKEQYASVLMIRDGLDLSPMFDDEIPDHLRVGKEWLLVFEKVI